MENQSKRDQIIDAFYTLMINEDISHISVSQIAKQAGISKGSIYYYFSSKDEILDALIKRTYSGALELAKEMLHRTDLSIFERLTIIASECISATKNFLKRSEVIRNKPNTDGIYDSAYFHQQFMKHSIIDFKDVYTELIQQEIDKGNLPFDSGAEIAEIILIVLAVKIDNTLSPSSDEDNAKTMQALVTLLEKGTGYEKGAFGIKFPYES